jgi:hypothetical protein
LWRDDTTFVKQFRRLQRVDTVYVLTTFALLAAGGVLVTVGAATATGVLWCVGVAAMAAACLIDRRRHHVLRRSAGDGTSPDRVDRRTGESDTEHRGR